MNFKAHIVSETLAAKTMTDLAAKTMTEEQKKNKTPIKKNVQHVFQQSLLNELFEKNSLRVVDVANNSFKQCRIVRILP